MGDGDAGQHALPFGNDDLRVREIGLVGPDAEDLEPGRVLVAEEVDVPAVEVGLGDPVVHVHQLAPLGRGAAQLVRPGGVEGDLVLHPVDDDRVDEGRALHRDDDGEVIRVHLHRWIRARAEDRRVAGERLAEDVAEGGAVTVAQVGVGVAGLIELVVVERLVAGLPVHGAELHPRDRVGQHLALRWVHQVQRGVLRATERGAVSHQPSVGRGHNVVDGPVAARRLGQGVGVEQHPVGLRLGIAQVELGDLLAGGELEIEPAAVGGGDIGDRGGDVGQLEEASPELGPLGEAVEHPAGVVVLPAEPAHELGVLAHRRLHPPVGVGDHGAEVGVGHFALGCARRSRIGRELECSGAMRPSRSTASGRGGRGDMSHSGGG